jgi:aspartyl/asparaginyl-tRNA synthetase
VLSLYKYLSLIKNKMTALIDPKKYSETVDLLRSFFLAKNFLEVHTQNRLSILAACEDPETVATYNYNGQVWPLPQTGQMWLEYELLSNPSVEGFFCVSTSYRAEPDPVEGRHETIFPMFEFEMKGGIEDLKLMEIELCEWLGIPLDTSSIKTYGEWGWSFNNKELDHDNEKSIGRGMITDFPEWTSPFWNMGRNSDGTSKKIDVILGGMETIGSAERSTDKEQMRDTFHTISDGQYADLLYGLFGKERVEKELEEFLSFDFFPRSGGGIGMQRLMSALS